MQDLKNSDGHVRWEVWIGEYGHPEILSGLQSHPYRALTATASLANLKWHFRGCFDSRSKAELVAAWYQEHGHVNMVISLSNSEVSKPPGHDYGMRIHSAKNDSP